MFAQGWFVNAIKGNGTALREALKIRRGQLMSCRQMRWMAMYKGGVLSCRPRNAHVVDRRLWGQVLLELQDLGIIRREGGFRDKYRKGGWTAAWRVC